MLYFVTVNAGNYLGRGKEYTEILFDSIKRNLKAGTEGKFVVFTDDAEDYAEGIEKRPIHGSLRGWWNKLWLFKSGHFQKDDRIVYMDLDTIIVSGLDSIIEYNGEFAILQDFYRPDGYQSSVMLWRGNALSYLWDAFEVQGFPDIAGGDQAFIEQLAITAEILQNLYPKCFVSYKKSCLTGIPKDAKVVVFHGLPRPHEAGGWVRSVWKVGGGNALELEMICNVDAEKLEQNVRDCLKRRLPWLDRMHDLQTNPNAILVGGGPSLHDFIEQIRFRQKHGEKIFALNNTWRFLENHGIFADYHVIADARPENKEFLSYDTETEHYLASHCDPSLFNALDECKVTVWHRGHDGMREIVEPVCGKNVAYLAGGSTVGMIAMSLAYALGYRKLHLFGYDSSYSEGEGHAYKQKLNEGELVLDVEIYDIVFKAAPWMVQQVNDFCELAPALIELGCEISTYGNGMLQYMAAKMSEQSVPETDIVEIDGAWWPKGDMECRASIEAFKSDLDHFIEYCDGFDVALQAGGNVGIWPRDLAAKFTSVYTFEPDNANFQCLVRNVPEQNVIKMQACLGDKPDFVKMFTIRQNCGAHFIDGNGIIPTLRIDDFGFEKLDFMQLDIEGFEYQAIVGATETIKRCKPVIVLEQKGLGDKYGYSDTMLENYLSDLGYHVVERIHRDVVYKHKGEMK